jgi:hypothetical protein
VKSRDNSLSESISKISLDKQKQILAEQTRTNPVVINSGMDNCDITTITPYDNGSMTQTKKDGNLISN